MSFASFKDYFASRWKAFLLISFVILFSISIINNRITYFGIYNFTRKMYEEGTISSEGLTKTSEFVIVKSSTHRHLSMSKESITFAKGSSVTPVTFLLDATRPFKTENDTNDIPGSDSMDKYVQRLTQSAASNTEILPTKSQRRDYELLISANETCMSVSDYANDTSQNFNINDVFLLMTVKSVCKSRDKRDAIRSSWGNESWIFTNLGIRAKLLFLLGDCESENDKENVISESHQYSDILQWSFQDTFQHLTIKECLFLQWYSNHCRQVPFLYQGDDDVLVNVENIIEYLFTLPDGAKKTIWAGSLLNGSPRITNPKSKYYVSEKLFAEKEYPSYVSGGGNILSGRVAVRFFMESLRTPMIPIDDAFLGILAKATGIEPTNVEGFESWGMDDPSPQNLAKIKTYHRVSPDKMVSMWNSMVTVN